jgi:hypothetical protein
VTLDLEKLLREGQISPQEHARLQQLAAHDTGSLGLNILIGFGVIATAAGTVALLHSAGPSIGLGLAIAALGISLIRRYPTQWQVLGALVLLVGALIAAGGILAITEGSVTGFLAVTVLSLAAGIAARSGLLIALATLALAGTLGAATLYRHAEYGLIIRQPALTVGLFSLLAWLAYRTSLRVSPEIERLALIFARTALLLVNFGFWVGSLWGDSFWRRSPTWELDSDAVAIPAVAFVSAWAVALLATGWWAVRQNRRWVVNLVAVFGAIHFYTQYFERLGAEPSTLVVAGLIALLIAIGLTRYNRAATPDTSRGRDA